MRAGNMDCRRIAIHAASAMSRREYEWAVWRMQRHIADGDEGARPVPPPDALVRSAIIGTVDVVDIVAASSSPWFGGGSPDARGLVLDNPEPCDAIPCIGTLGYFAWKRSGSFAPVKPWMRLWGRVNRDAATLDMFAGVAHDLADPPPKPFGRPK